MRPIPLHAVAAALAVFAAFGCGGADRAADDSEIVRLVYWPAQNEQERRLATELVTEWNRAHPGIQVTVQPIPAGQSSEEVLLAAIVAGTTPDVCSNIWPGIVNDFVRADGLVALDGFADFDSLMQSRVDSSLHDQFRSDDGRYHQLPWKSNPVMMLYNRRLLREAGFDHPPRTYSEYLAAAERVSADLDGDGQRDRWMGYRDIRPIWWQRYFDFYPFYIGASGGKTLYEHGEPALDSAATAEVLGFFREIYRRGHFPLTTYQGSAFVGERIATEFTGPYNIAWMEENAPAEMEYGYAPLPVADGQPPPYYTYGDYKNIVIFANTAHPEEAWEFVKFLVSREADLRLLEITRQIPVRRNLLENALFSDFFRRNPNVVPFAEQVAHTRSVDAVSAFQEVLDALAQEFEAASVYGVRSPAESYARAAERIDVIHEWSL
ncbi:MAG TPA: extracellular solute-binding protein [Rhodothermales bacterium]